MPAPVRESPNFPDPFLPMAVWATLFPLPRQATEPLRRLQSRGQGVILREGTPDTAAGSHAASAQCVVDRECAADNPPWVCELHRHVNVGPGNKPTRAHPAYDVISDRHQRHSSPNVALVEDIADGGVPGWIIQSEAGADLLLAAPRIDGGDLKDRVALDEENKRLKNLFAERLRKETRN